MGQYWILLNREAGEILPHYGKLTEGIWHRPEALVPLLQVKKAVTLLEEPESPRLRMQKMEAEWSDEEFVWEKRPAVPVVGASSSVLERLPTEIINIIASELTEDCIDCICFALCSRRLWAVARRVIEAYLHEIDIACSWAGDRLICVGDYMDPDDLPPEGFNDAEDLDCFIDDAGFLHSFYEVAESWPTPSRDFHRHTFIEEGLKARRVRPSSKDGKLWTSLKGPDFYWGPCDDHTLPSSDNPRLLRNLTTHEYVHDSTLFEWNKLLLEWDSAQEKPRLPYRFVSTQIVSPVTLGHLCAIRVFWSSEGVNFPYKEDIHRGVWAGHRFDIVPATELAQMDKDGRKWKDVSQEMVDEMENIWRYCLPDGWKSGAPYLDW